MGVSEKDELLFTECKESVEDVFGWKSIIFLPQNTFWKVLIMITVSVSYVITTIKVFYLKTNKIFYVLEVFCDSIYFVDVLCAVLHFGLGQTRKLRHGERRAFILLLIDIISLIPLNLLFEYLIYKEDEKSYKYSYILRINVVLRIYQVPRGFSDIKKAVSRISTYYFLTFLEMFTYGALLTHLFGCFMQEYLDQNLREKCLNQFAFCVIENDLLTFALLDLNYIAPLSKYPLANYEVLLIAEFLVGFIFTYGFITPLVIYVNLVLLKQVFEYSYKRGQLRLLIDNMIEEKVLKRKLTDYFHYAWTYGKGDDLPEIINLFPLSYRKTIFCDIHWEALRHSDFLQSLSNGCKRSLCLRMRTEFLLPKTELFQKQKMKTSFVYLESGLVQVLAEENSESPLLNLSDGTVLSEISFFYQTGSKALVRTGKFSVIHVLKCTDLFRVLLHYPKDMKKMWHKMKLRLKIARAVHKNKTEICPLFFREPDYTLSTLTTVKWLKQQFRALVRLEKGGELKKADLSDEEDNTSATHQRQIYFLETQLEHTSLYLFLLNISDEGEKVYDFVCLKESFPWLLDPDSHFLRVWKFIDNAATLVVILLYPGLLGWFQSAPFWFFNIAAVINLINILDVLMQLITAVKVKGIVTKKFSTMITQRFSSLGFYFDCLAALPLFLIGHFCTGLQAPFKLNLLFGNALLKAYKLVPVINNLSYSSKSGIYYRATIKYILLIYLIVYWAAAIFHLMKLDFRFYEFSKRMDLEINEEDKNKKEDQDILVSLYVALYMVLDIPNKSMRTDDISSYIVYFVGYIISNYLYYVWQGQIVACYVLEHSNEIQYRSLIEIVDDFMLQHKVALAIKKRVLDTMEFQWLYDKGNYITQKRRILEDLSTDLREEVDRTFLLPILKKSRLFKYENDEFFMDLCLRARRLAVPSNSLLMTFGTQAMALYIIHKGYVQVNSFIVGDSHLDISTPLIFTSGDTFPVVVALSQIPSSITAITLTDCELLILDVEDILTALMTYRVLPDVVLALKKIDLTPMSSARLGLSKIKRNLELDAESYNKPFIRLKRFGIILKYLFIKKGINPKSYKYLLWEIARSLFILFTLITWPLVFGRYYKWEKRTALIYTVLVLDVISSLIDFYLRLHVGYYNSLGIYVMHPLATLRHYLTSSFLLDFIAFAPNLHMIHLVRMNQLNFGVSTVVVHMIMRSLSFYRIQGLFNYVTHDLKKFLNFIKLLKFIFYKLFAMHYYINLMAFFYIQGKDISEFRFNPNYQFEPNLPHEFYFYQLSLTVSILIRGQFFFENKNIYNFICVAILGTFAMMVETFTFSVFTLTVTSSRTNFTVYQYYFRNFVKYLSEEKVDDIISEQAVNYFEFKWQQCRGIDMNKIFSTFPYTLHEDILLPLYRDSLTGVRCLLNANEAFYRALSRYVQVITLRSGSTVIFSNQVQGDIFFVHRGKCFVEEVSKILIKGSVIGDINDSKLMKHTIKALTNVELLMISSQLFFLTLGNFYVTKMAFQKEAAAAEDFLESIYVDRHKSYLIEFESVPKGITPPEAEFKVAKHGSENTGTGPFEVKKKRTLWDSNSALMRVLDFIFFMDAYITFIVVPIFIGIALLTWWALFIIYCLDAVWVIKIILTIFNSKTGNHIHRRKVIILNYLRKIDGMVLHILSVLPIELIVMAYYGRSVFSQYCHIMYYCYSNRLLRIPHIHYYIKSKMHMLLMNIYLKLLNILVFEFALINLIVAINLQLSRDKDFSKVVCRWEANRSQLDDIIHSYFYVLNRYVVSGISTALPETPSEIFFQVLIGVWSLLSKAVVVTQVLLLIYVTHFTKLDQLLKLQQLEKYLSIRDVSPALLQKMQKYSWNLLNTYKEEAHPSFLTEVPPFIRTNIMANLYLHHLSECYVFQGVPEVFLRQVVMRLERFIFFPGDHIVEVGDVDQNMYFIHKGEVKCVEIDERYPVLERTVDLLITGENFGVMQGISFSRPHENTFRAKVLSDILVLNYYKWQDVRLAFPEITEKIYKKFQQPGPKEI